MIRHDHEEMIISRGKGKRSLVPWTCRTRMRLATRIVLSFLNISNYNCTQKAELASTRKMRSLGLPYGGACWWSTLIRTPSASGFSRSLPTILTSKEKLMLEQFLKGIFMIPLLGILIIFTPVALSSSSFRQTICGTSPLLCMDMTKGANSSICNSRTPLISVDTSSSGMLALMKTVIGSPSFIGSSISATSSPFSTALTVKILSRLNFSLLGKGWTLVLILIIWNSLRCPSSK